FARARGGARWRAARARSLRAVRLLALRPAPAEHALGQGRGRAWGGRDRSLARPHRQARRRGVRDRDHRLRGLRRALPPFVPSWRRGTACRDLELGDSLAVGLCGTRTAHPVSLSLAHAAVRRSLWLVGARALPALAREHVAAHGSCRGTR